MTNIYLKVTIEKNWRSQNFNFFLLQLKNQRSGRKTVSLFLLIQFWMELWRLKVNEFMHFVEQKYKL